MQPRAVDFVAIASLESVFLLTDRALPGTRSRQTLLVVADHWHNTILCLVCRFTVIVASPFNALGLWFTLHGQLLKLLEGHLLSLPLLVHQQVHHLAHPLPYCDTLLEINI